jgi:hypothetical protein
MDPDSFAKSYPSLWNRILDANKSEVCVIDMPPYRRMKKSAQGRRSSRKK